MSTVRVILRRLALTAVLALGTLPALGQEFSSTMPQPGMSTMPAYGQAGVGPSQSPPSDGLAWPPPGGRLPPGGPPPLGSQEYGLGRPGGVVTADSATIPSVVANPPPVERPTESTWYYRLDSFSWNERSDGMDFVTEAGPISTLGYLHRYGQERLRFELFGGTVSYDGGAQLDDGSIEPYHQSFGTNYLGVRGEYDLLIEPAAWSRARLLLGVGTRFWIRDLRDAVTPLGTEVSGYQETWWTFYPYVGLETRESDEPGLKLFGSARFGITPLTFQHATFFDTTVYPRCGLTGRAELGVCYQRLWASAVVEAMTWGESAVVRDTFQPASRMLTVGGQLGYRF